MSTASAPLFPPVDPARQPITAPITEVTLLEDRAIVRREGTVHLSGGGRHRLVLHGPSPLLQDVSLRVEVLEGSAAIADARTQRALRARHAEQPEALRALLEEERALRTSLTAAGDDGARAYARYLSVLRMIAQGIRELPDDVAWGLLRSDAWGETFDALFARARALRAELIDSTEEKQRLTDELGALLLRLRELRRRDYDTVAWIELDLVLPEGAGGPEAEAQRLAISYTVGSALWRPLHRAELRGDTLRFSTMAAIWQQTGEDWSGVQVVCSTARASLGIEPPLLADDLLKAKRKAEEVRLAARQVAVQQTGPGGSEAPDAPAGIDLPGVDDGGEVQNLRAPRPADVPSDGRLTTVPLSAFSAPAQREYVLMPELEEQVHLKSTQRNTGSTPILAGPVELIRDSGAIGWGEVLFVAPGAPFVLGFGPQDELRVHRQRREREKADEIDKWTHRDVTVEVTLSNIGAAARTVQLTERIPVSEVEEVRIAVDDKRTTAGMALDAQNGFCRWSHTVPGDSISTVVLRWRLSTSPGVRADGL